MNAKILFLDPEQVELGWRAREVGDVNGLASSISREGQVQPITVTSVDGNGSYRLVAGARRLAACQQMGFRVAAVVAKKMSEHRETRMQIAENAQREDFDALELGEGLKRWKALYEHEHPETVHGVTGRKGKESMVDSSREPAPRFTLEAARLLGCSEGKIKEYLAMASLPKRIKEKAQKASTRRERNQAVREAVRQVRVAKKKQRLEEQAAKAQDKAGEPVEGARVVLKMQDNLAYFEEATAEDAEIEFDLILTDPPYGQRQSLIQHITRTAIDTDFGNWDRLEVSWVARAAPLLADGGQMIVFCPMEAVGEYKFVMEQVGLIYRGALVWRKTNPGTMYRPGYLSSLECVVWATKGNGFYFKPHENAGSTDAQNWIEGPICGGNERLDHPTQKPEWLIRRLLERHAHDNARVLDPFAGVGTVPAVCKIMELACVGIEREAEYVHQAALRLKGIAE